VERRKVKRLEGVGMKMKQEVKAREGKEGKEEKDEKDEKEEKEKVKDLRGGGERERELRETSSSIVERERARARAKEVEQMVGKRRCCCVSLLWKSLIRGMRRRSVHSSCRRKLHLS
jgi:hypothetical protein